MMILVKLGEYGFDPDQAPASTTTALQTEQSNPALLDGVLARPRIFHDQPAGGPLRKACGRVGFASAVIAPGDRSF